MSPIHKEGNEHVLFDAHEGRMTDWLETTH